MIMKIFLSYLMSRQSRFNYTLFLKLVWLYLLFLFPSTISAEEPVVIVVEEAPLLSPPPSQIPVTPPEKIQVGDIAYVTTEKIIFTEPATSSNNEMLKGQGRLVGGAKIEILAEEGELIRFQLSGWQPEMVETLIYEEKGNFILVAELGLEEGDITSLLFKETVESDYRSSQNWRRLTLTAWTDKTHLNLSSEALVTYSAKRFEEACTGCHHRVHPATKYLPNQWIGILRSNRHHIEALAADEYDLILNYLQHHARKLPSNN